ncbi:MAG: lyase family protein, partial [Candidatus Woesearchaeota archaeon]|nr:lyase family protein [Candidatus Woesearchaeota archaeon]
MKLWDKKSKLKKEIEDFTVGKDYLLDQKLIKYDCEASFAHAAMLEKINILTKEELGKIESVFEEIKSLAKQGKFTIKKEQEDCHTAIESYLTEKLGDIGKKIHTGRSRND